MEAIVADSGEVVIPEALRLKLGITAQTVLDFREENGELVAVKISEEDPVSQVMGCLKTDMSTDEIMAYLRGTP